MKPNKFLLLILLANFALAQTTAKIRNVKAGGFHKIIISPELRSLSQADLSDFRIYDAAQNEVPYLKIEDDGKVQQYDFEEYEIGRELLKHKNFTPIVIQNPLKEISSLTLFIANTNINKTYDLYGSDDLEHWFGITENQKLEDLSDASKTYALKTISFPRCSYRHLKIVFNDKKTLPINVLRIGNLKSAAKNGIDLLPVAPDFFEITNTPGTKKTLVSVRFKKSTVINKFVFNISGQQFYNRKVRVYKKAEYIRKRKKHTSWEDITGFNLTSLSNNIFPLDIFEKEFYIEIDNLDDFRLPFNKIDFYQIPVVFAVNLKPGGNYTIKTGDRELRAPQYDLSYFRDSIPENLPEAIVTDLKVQSQKENAEMPKPFWQSQWFLWACIGVGGIVLLIFYAKSHERHEAKLMITFRKKRNSL